MKALTIRQPWASLIAAGVKTIETRSWSTKYRGPLAIHAGKHEPAVCAYQHLPLDQSMQWLQGCISAGISSPDTRRFASGYSGSWWPDPAKMPLGAVVATCTLADVVPIVASDDFSALAPYVRPMENRSALRRTNAPSWPDDVTDQLPFGDFTPGRYAFLLDRITPIDPVPCRGKQGLWHLPSDIEETVRGLQEGREAL